MNVLPSLDNHYYASHAELLLDSFYRLLGKRLIAENTAEPHRALFEAPFAVVSHNTNNDPIFNYANQTALHLFECDWESFTQLPSRYSAELNTQHERDRLLDQVTQYGFIDDYTGVRISSTGKRFLVEDAIVWNLIDAQGVYHGQAAALYQWRFLNDAD